MLTDTNLCPSVNQSVYDSSSDFLEDKYSFFPVSSGVGP
jgi:hypothetical protein